MNRLLPLTAWLLLTALAASVGCWLSGHWLHRPSGATPAEAHQWMHRQLALSAEQEARLAPVEQHYEERRRHFSELVRLANRELAEAILADQTDSPRVRAALDQIHDAMNGLQHATLDHVFDMRPTLTPAQYDKLLNLTANGLYELDDEDARP